MLGSASKSLSLRGHVVELLRRVKLPRLRRLSRLLKAKHSVRLPLLSLIFVKDKRGKMNIYLTYLYASMYIYPCLTIYNMSYKYYI